MKTWDESAVFRGEIRRFSPENSIQKHPYLEFAYRFYSFVFDNLSPIKHCLPMKRLLLLCALAIPCFMACEKMDEAVSPDVEQQQDPLADVIRIAMDGASMLEDGATRATANRRVNLDAISCKIHPATRAGEANDTLYYVVNYADNAGFAIVSADEHATDGERLIAVTESGSYTAGDRTSNEGFNLYMDMVDNMSVETPTTRGFELDTTVLRPDISRIVDSVTYSPWYGVNPLLQVKWGQGKLYWFDSDSFVFYENTYDPAYPYNKYCYKEEGDSICPAGCTAVAMAQIMSYHKTPNTLTLEHDGYRTITLNWNEISTWTGGNDYAWTESSGDTIAVLFKEIGERVDMHYEPNGSSAELIKVGPALYWLGYKSPSIVGYDYDALCTELQSYCPIYMSGDREDGVDSDGNTKYTGHAWVADGYKYRTCQIDTYKVYPAPLGEERWVLFKQITSTHRYVHYNWGSNGDCNGFFSDTCFRLNQASEEAGGYDNSGSNDIDKEYRINVRMITGIEKR